MTEDFEHRLRRGLQTQAGRVTRPGDPVGDVGRRVRRQDVVRRSLTSLGAVAAFLVVVGVGVPTLTDTHITLDPGPAADRPTTGEPPTTDPSATDPAATDPAQPEDGPSPAGDENGDGPDCSAAGLETSAEAPVGLPAAVAETRARLIDAAVACDYEALADVAAAGHTFSFSFGGGDDPAEHWRRAESRGEEPLRMLVGLLDRPYAALEDADPALFVWPSAHAYEQWSDVPAEERDALRPLYDDDAFADFAAFGGYYGYRVGITEDGRWSYFVAGD